MHFEWSCVSKYNNRFLVTGVPSRPNAVRDCSVSQIEHQPQFLLEIDVFVATQRWESFEFSHETNRSSHICNIRWWKSSTPFSYLAQTSICGFYHKAAWDGKKRVLSESDVKLELTIGPQRSQFLRAALWPSQFLKGKTTSTRLFPILTRSRLIVSQTASSRVFNGSESRSAVVKSPTLPPGGDNGPCE